MMHYNKILIFFIYFNILLVFTYYLYQLFFYDLNFTLHNNFNIIVNFFYHNRIIIKNYPTNISKNLFI